MDKFIYTALSFIILAVLFALPVALGGDKFTLAEVGANTSSPPTLITTHRVEEEVLQKNGCSISPKFPDEVLNWCNLITKYAGKHNLPPDLVAAVILQESGGNPKAISKSGAVGLMQVMPSDGIAATFLCVNGPCFANRPTTQELLDPEFNIKYGTRMFSRLVRKHGNFRLALMEYGPMDQKGYYSDRVLKIFKIYGK